MDRKKIKARLELEDGSVFHGYSFGAQKSVAGEVVFNTSMMGYPESLTDPSYYGQILVLTYPLVGNYGIPESKLVDGLDEWFESDGIKITGLIVSEYSFDYSHWSACKSLGDWLVEHNVPALYGIDTRMLTKRLRDEGTMLGRMLFFTDELDFYDPNKINLVEQVSIKEPVEYGSGDRKVVLIDCGCKDNIIRSLIQRDIKVKRVPWNYDFSAEEYDGLFITNGPGDPKMCHETINNVKKALEGRKPIFGICLGNQLLSLAAGADTYKLKFGHRSQNQPCVEVGTKRCYITSQNHGFAVDGRTLPEGWEPWFVNANDGTNEGIRHVTKPFMSVQFHPEAAPGPVDTGILFDDFKRMLL
ncbi:MAG TPA: glutamine-hydrolyzing carbamoyl-phosphate synthase small subunit [bacterium]|nr:glutamine-hydrolyzing carbamoyl-phosphate synthase small subunit [bacterium]HPN42411.1 glutamine-hydrolyzing carbamoyl-phosphate synthase small subunit [bacterium]